MAIRGAGLYRQEKRFAFPLLFASIMLFYAGVSFAYFVVFPLMFSFFAAVSPEGVTMMTDIASYLDFILTIFFAFGLAFEVPIVTVMLVWSGLVSTQTLKKARPFVFLGAFLAGMLLTPPDAISQTLLAVPVYLLYESGLIHARGSDRTKKRCRGRRRSGRIDRMTPPSTQTAGTSTPPAQPEATWIGHPRGPAYPSS